MTATLKRALLVVLSIATMGACSAQGYVALVFGDHYGEAARVVECESGWRPEAMSAGGGNHGLFQINSVHRASFERVTGQPWSAVYHPYWNAVFAKWLYDQQGWRPWACKP